MALKDRRVKGQDARTGCACIKVKGRSAGMDTQALSYNVRWGGLWELWNELLAWFNFQRQPLTVYYLSRGFSAPPVEKSIPVTSLNWHIQKSHWSILYFTYS